MAGRIDCYHDFQYICAMNPISARLLGQQLICPQFVSPHDVVEWMGAMQAQEYRMMRWAVGMRTKKPSAKAFEKDYNDGRIVRGHLFRTTWQLVAGEDWRWMLEQHCTTWCENPDNPRSECHGWSSAPLYENSAMVLGVKPAQLGCREIEIRPDVQGYTWARGTVPTPLGYVAVEWKQGEALKISGPKGQVKRVVLPGKAEIVSDEAEIEVKL